MPWVRSHWRNPPGWGFGSRSGSGSGGFTRGGSKDFDYAAEIRITASLIEKGVPREKLSTRYQELWDEAQKWIENGKPEDFDDPNLSGGLPPGAKWITDAMYELDGAYYLVRRRKRGRT